MSEGQVVLILVHEGRGEHDGCRCPPPSPELSGTFRKFPDDPPDWPGRLCCQHGLYTDATVPGPERLRARTETAKPLWPSLSRSAQRGYAPVRRPGYSGIPALTRPWTNTSQCA